MWCELCVISKGQVKTYIRFNLTFCLVSVCDSAIAAA